MVDDQAMKDGPHIVAKPSFVLVSAGEFVGEELGPELLEDLVGEVSVAELQAKIAFNGVVVAADQLQHRLLAVGSSGMGAGDRGPVGGEVGQMFSRHRLYPGTRGPVPP